ncbi:MULTISPECIES: carbon-nitrogen hydrolase family protein [Xanthomonas]|uniref:Carbon-nitrogen hydrolase family protein n=1 Tax=Xanthomonas campestris pv. phaseoli TaxID=317013 RepID=A0A7Z7J5Z8_XANCH
MRLTAAQILSTPGQIEENISKHLNVIRLPARKNADVLVFPELSLTGYEPALAQALAVHPIDGRFDAFQVASDRYGMLIAIGVPTKGAKGIEISMICFQPGLERTTYSKQQLHLDELPFFTPGTEQRVLRHADQVLAPAICYESLQASHAE